MRTSCISDVHVKMGGGPEAEILSAFLAHPLVESSEQVLFLGDIFDLLVGPYPEYQRAYPEFFDWVHKALAGGKRISFFEGNHDFHARGLFENLGIRYLKSHNIQEIFGKRYYFSHGDDIDLDNISYRIYKKAINNPFIDAIARHVADFGFVKAVGERASANSRAHNSEKYSAGPGAEKIRANFRKSALRTAQGFGVDVVVCGHSHIKEELDLGDGKRYLNNGYVPLTRCFTHVDQEGAKLVDLVTDARTR